MAKKSLIEKISQDNLCLGCGLCESVCGKNAVEMKLDSAGFFKPLVKEVLFEKEKIIDKICPGKNIVNDLHFSKEETIWGRIIETLSGFSTDPEVRTKGSSGGIVSAIAIHMLETRQVQGVLQVGGDSNDYERNILKVSRSKSDVLNCASSRYAPALIFDKIFSLLDGNDDTYCFIGKPCDISALKNFLSIFPKYTDRFKLTVSIMCAGMPSFEGTKAIVNEFTPTPPIKNLVYRGNGWPGYFSFKDNSGTSFRKTYNDSWGKTLNKHLNFRCKICPDGIGLQADIAVGDAWETNDGYPDFTERDGQSLVIVRTPIGDAVLKEGKNRGSMNFEPLKKDKIALMQPYQFNRRKRVGARVFAFSMKKLTTLNFQNLNILNASIKESPLILAKEFWGTFKRIGK